MSAVPPDPTSPREVAPPPATPGSAPGSVAPSAGAAASSAHEAMLAPSRGADTAAIPRPRPPSRIVAILFHDLGLKLLALVLAGVTWYLVRNQLQTESDAIPVAVDLVDLPPTIRVRPDPSRSTILTLSGTKGTVDLAADALHRSGLRIALRLPPLVGKQGDLSLRSPDDFSFPFEGAEVVRAIERPVRIEWFRTDTIVVELEKPALEPFDMDFAPSYPTLDVTSVKVTGPADVVERLKDGRDALRLDPVDAASWLKEKHDLATPFPFTVGFARWRAASPGLRSEALLTIDPPTVSGKAKIRENRPMPVRFDVAQLQAPGSDPAAYRGFDVRISDTAFDARTRKLEAIVRGDVSAITEATSARGAWILVVDLPPPPDAPDASLESVSARLRLVPRDPASTTSRLTLISPQSVYVTMTPRK